MLFTTFSDWRHKLLTLYLSLITAISAGTAWMYDHPSLRSWAGVPLLSAGILGAPFFLWERRVGRVTNAASYLCSSLEPKVLNCPNGPNLRKELKLDTPKLESGREYNSAFDYIARSRHVFGGTMPLLFGTLSLVYVGMGLWMVVARPTH